MELSAIEPVTEAAVLEGSVLVNILKPETSKTFQDYEDIKKDSLKATT